MRFSLHPSDHPTPTLCSQSALLLNEMHTSCSVCFDTSGKELWHRVISSGHSPSAHVRKQSHSCRWDFALCNSIRGAGRFFLMWMLNNSNVWFIYVHVISQRGAAWVTVSVRNMHCFFWADWQSFSCLALWGHLFCRSSLWCDFSGVALSLHTAQEVFSLFWLCNPAHCIRNNRYHEALGFYRPLFLMWDGSIT